MNDEILRYLSKKIQDELAVMKDDMALGNAKDFGAYQFACGVVRGLLVANNFIIELAERMETDND